MAETNRSQLDVLVTLAVQSVPVPDVDVFASAVTERVRARQPVAAPVGARRAFGQRRSWRPAALAGGVLAVLVLGTLVVSPVRTAVAGLLGVDGVHITRAGPPATLARPPTSATPTTLTPVDALAALQLGQATTLVEAAQLVGFAMRLPTVKDFQHPDAVYVNRPPSGGMASMVYLSGAGRPAASAGGVAALLSEFRGHLEAGYFQKLAGSGTSVEAVVVADAGGYWLSGAPHQFFYVGADGTVASETIRLATNTLLWSAGGITYRLEGALSRDTAIAVADSMR